jgi:hypothetical protein
MTDIEVARELVRKCEASLGRELRTNIIDLLCDNLDWSYDRCEAAGLAIYKEKGIKR